MNYKENRPWGTFENLLDTDYCKVKQIVIEKSDMPLVRYKYYQDKT